MRPVPVSRLSRIQKYKVVKIVKKTKMDLETIARTIRVTALSGKKKIRPGGGIGSFFQ